MLHSTRVHKPLIGVRNNKCVRSLGISSKDFSTGIFTRSSIFGEDRYNTISNVLGLGIESPLFAEIKTVI